MSPSLLARLTREVALGLTDLSPCGVECAFVPFGARFGVKCYRTAGARDFAFAVQRKAAWGQAGPWAYLTFDCPDPRWRGRTAYCYVTRRVKTIEYMIYRDLAPERERTDDLAALVLGGAHADNHYGNYGLDEFNRLVILDFGRCSGLGRKVVKG